MHPLGPLDPHKTPLNVLFPDEYRASCRMIARDLALFGAWISGFVVMVAWIAS